MDNHNVQTQSRVQTWAGRLIAFWVIVGMLFAVSPTGVFEYPQIGFFSAIAIACIMGAIWAMAGQPPTEDDGPHSKNNHRVVWICPTQGDRCSEIEPSQQATSQHSWVHVETVDEIEIRTKCRIKR